MLAVELANTFEDSGQLKRGVYLFGRGYFIIFPSKRRTELSEREEVKGANPRMSCKKKRKKEKKRIYRKGRFIKKKSR